MICRECGNTIDADSTFCKFCGYKIPDEHLAESKEISQMVCSECGNIIDTDSAVCKFCGYKLTEKTEEKAETEFEPRPDISTLKFARKFFVVSAVVEALFVIIMLLAIRLLLNMIFSNFYPPLTYEVRTPVRFGAIAIAFVGIVIAKSLYFSYASKKRGIKKPSVLYCVAETYLPFFPISTPIIFGYGYQDLLLSIEICACFTLLMCLLRLICFTRGDKK